MDIKILKNYRTLVISPDSELNQNAVWKIHKSADKLLKKTALKNVVFDMRHMQFLDILVMGVIMSICKKACTIGGNVAVFGMLPDVEQIF